MRSLRRSPGRFNAMQLCVAGLCMAGLAACGAVANQYDTRSDGDQVRDLARLVPDDTRAVTDRVNGGDGDNTDWKKMILDAKGDLTITVSVDRPEELNGAELALHDEFGQLIDRKLISPQEPVYRFRVKVSKIPSEFYVRTFTRAGLSTYTVGYNLKEPPAPPPPPPPPTVVVQKPPEPEPKPRVRRRRRPRPAANPTPPPPPPPTPSADPISAKVFKVTDSGDGGSLLRMKVNKSGMVKKGSRGTLYINGQRQSERVSIRAAQGSILTGWVKMPYGRLNGRITVKF